MVEKRSGAGVAAEIKDLLVSSESSEIVREKLEGHKGSVNSLDVLREPSSDGYFGA